MVARQVPREPSLRFALVGWKMNPGERLRAPRRGL